MLKITHAADPITVERLIVTVYGQPGAGKTSLAFTADAPLLLDFDRGAYRSANRKDTVQVAAWADVAELAQADMSGYRTIVVDTVGRALDSLTADIIRRNPKAGRGGALTLQGYGTLKTEFAGWLKSLVAIGKDVVLIAHMDEQRNGDDVLERLDVQGGSKGEIHKVSDAMGRVFVRGNTRMLDFSPREGSFGKNPGQLPELTIPHPSADPAFLATTIATIKANLNKLSEEQVEAQAKLDEWRMVLGDAEDAEAVNALIDVAKSKGNVQSAMLNRRALDLGLRYDGSQKQYVARAEAA